MSAAEMAQRFPEADEQLASSVHEYLSTACWHGDHNYCQSMTGYQGAKRPGRCKFCDAKCTCWCHRAGVTNYKKPVMS